MCKILVNLHANDIFPPRSFGMVKSYTMPCTVESASLEPQLGNKFVAGGEDMWIRLFDFHTGEEIGEFFSCSIFMDIKTALNKIFL